MDFLTICLLFSIKSINSQKIPLIDNDDLKIEVDVLGTIDTYFNKFSTLRVLIFSGQENLADSYLKEFHKKLDKVVKVYKGTFLENVTTYNSGDMQSDAAVIFISKKVFEETSKSSVMIPRLLCRYLILYDDRSCSCKELLENGVEIMRRFYEKHIVALAATKTLRKCFWFLIPREVGIKLPQDNETLEKLPVDFNGLEIKITMFPRPPTAFLDSKWKGLDDMVFATMASYLNFTPVFLPETDGYDYGRFLSNNTFVGALGDVVNKRTDIAGRFLMSYKTDEIEFTHFVRREELCVVVPKAKKIPQWLMVFHCFSLSTWTIIQLTFFFTWFCWYHVKSLPISKKKRVSSAFLDMFSIMLSVSSKLHKKFLQRIFLIGCLSFNVILIGIFQGSLVGSFSVISYYNDINTLQDLVKSELPISTSLDVFRNDTDLMRSLNKKIISTNFNSSLERAAYFGDVAALERQDDAELLMKTVYLSNDGSPLLHIVPDCPSTNYLSYIVPKGSPYLPAFNLAINRFWEAGLLDKWYGDAIDFMVMRSFYHKRLRTDVNPALTMGDVQTAFYILLLGLSLSTLTFVAEVIVFRIKQRRYMNKFGLVS